MKEPKDRRDAYLIFRVTQSEKNTITQEGKTEGKTISEYLRSLILG